MVAKNTDRSIRTGAPVARALHTLGTSRSPVVFNASLLGLLSRSLLLAGVIFFSIFSTPKPASAFIDVVEIVATCGQLVPGVPGVACVCDGLVGNLDAISRGEIFCSTIGWTQNYPIQILEACPYRVNRFPPTSNGCGSDSFGTLYWLPQTFLGIVDFGVSVCANHDLRFGTCGFPEDQANALWRQDTNTVCNDAFPYNDDWNITMLGWCKSFGETYLTGIILFGGSESYDQAQKKVCQCGPDTTCMGGQARFCINCPPDPGGQGGGIGGFGPGPGPGGCSPGDDFC